MQNSGTNGAPGPKPDNGDTQAGWRERHWDWRQQRRDARSRRPFGGLSFALILVLLGVLLLLNQMGVVSGDIWWKLLLIGIGAIFILNGLLNLRSPGRPGHYSTFVIGGILIAIGTLFIVGLSQWWSFALIAAGIALLIRVFVRR